ncbi:MAG: hypothetical protein KTR22_09460 [Flavobacteriaceae bacterium]|nr:hypothetical protein [Flavobacteriaceae bacterium]
MTREEFRIDIKADKSVIWKALWDDEAYRKWTGVFYEGSYAVSDGWKEGSNVHFLVPDGSGIYSRIEKHIPNEFIQFKHLGNVVDKKEQPIDEETKKWSGATETYNIEQGDNTNTLIVEIDIMDEHLEYMTKTFSKALEVLKDNCTRD